MRFLLAFCFWISIAYANHSVLVLSDIHLNPYYNCQQSSKPCTSLQELIAKDTNQWPKILESKTLNHYHEDTNNALLIQGLNKIKPIADEQQISSIFILGDFLAHHFYALYERYAPETAKDQNSYRKFCEKTFSYVLMQIHQRFPKAKIYFVLGNNDSDTGDYSFPSKDMLNTMANKAALYAEANIKDNFAAGGYFKLALDPRTEIIGLNTVILSQQGLNQKIALMQLTWLEKTLKAAKTSGKKVIFLQHIPFGLNAYKTSYWQETPFLNPLLQQQYLNLLDKYSSSILNIYAGHLHAEYFSLINKKTPLIGTIALNSIIGNNPGFKILNLHSDNSFENYKSYITDLNNPELNWQLLYEFKPSYGDLNFLADFPKNLKDARVIDYRRFYNGANPSLPQPISNDKDWPYYYCAISNMTSEEYQHCRA